MLTLTGIALHDARSLVLEEPLKGARHHENVTVLKRDAGA
jgi:hypothetical protein